MMVLPMLLGYWLDRYLATLPLFLIGGLILGMSAGILQLIKMTGAGPPSANADSDDR